MIWLFIILKDYINKQYKFFKFFVKNSHRDATDKESHKNEQLNYSHYTQENMFKTKKYK